MACDFLTSRQWELIQPILVPPSTSPRRGRPPRDLFPIINGILWKLAFRLPWTSVPSEFGPWPTLYHYISSWEPPGLIRKVVVALLDDVSTRGAFDYRLAVKSELVRFEPANQHLIIFLPASIVWCWQVRTAMLFFSTVASLIEQKSNLKSPANPLLSCFSISPPASRP